MIIEEYIIFRFVWIFGITIACGHIFSALSRLLDAGDYCRWNPRCLYTDGHIGRFFL